MMTPLDLCSAAHYLPDDRTSTHSAVTDGHYDPREYERDGYLSAATEAKLFPFEMAQHAATQCLAQAAVDGGDLAGAVFANIHRHGQPRLWSPAFGLHHALGLGQDRPVLSLNQGCNGLMTGLSMLQETIHEQPMLFVGADRFSASGFDRWASDYGLIYGDAAAAFCVARGNAKRATERLGRILHIAVQGASEIEEMHRDSQPSEESGTSWLTEYDVRATKKKYLASKGREGFVGPLNHALETLRTGLEQSPHWKGKARWLLPPLVGDGIRLETYERLFGPLAERSGWEIGRELGHLGTTDGWVVLSLLHQQGLLKPKDQVILLSAGVGFSCGVALIEIG